MFFRIGFINLFVCFYLGNGKEKYFCIENIRLCSTLIHRGAVHFWH